MLLPDSSYLREQSVPILNKEQYQVLASWLKYSHPFPLLVLQPFAHRCRLWLLLPSPLAMHFWSLPTWWNATSEQKWTLAVIVPLWLPSNELIAIKPLTLGKRNDQCVWLVRCPSYGGNFQLKLLISISGSVLLRGGSYIRGNENWPIFIEENGNIAYISTDFVHKNSDENGNTIFEG